MVVGPSVDQRARIGDWEGDAVDGKGRKSALLTMVERLCNPHGLESQL